MGYIIHTELFTNGNATINALTIVTQIRNRPIIANGYQIQSVREEPRKETL